MLEPGDILDHYRLEAAAARSGMGVLYRAADLNTGRTVAVKIPHPEMEADPVLLERFRREQEIGQTLDHPGIVKTFNSEQRSRLYMVLEWVDGRLSAHAAEPGTAVPARSAPWPSPWSYATRSTPCTNTAWSTAT